MICMKKVVPKVELGEGEGDAKLCGVGREARCVDEGNGELWPVEETVSARGRMPTSSRLMQAYKNIFFCPNFRIFVGRWSDMAAEMWELRLARGVGVRGRVVQCGS